MASVLGMNGGDNGDSLFWLPKLGTPSEDEKGWLRDKK